MANLSPSHTGSLLVALRTLREVENELMSKPEKQALAVAVGNAAKAINAVLRNAAYGVGDGKPRKWTVSVDLPGQRRVRR